MDYEKLGEFYLGREVEEGSMAVQDTPLLYDASDLTTHAVIVGMTGSGKTGLGVALIEEAALDGVPVLAIDPKGDLGNLALTFPGLRPEEFEPWLDPRDAEKAEVDLSVYAEMKAEEWRAGLESWGQDAGRIERLRASATVTVYTPGSSAGRPISILRSFAAPTATVLADGDLLAERLATTATGLLTLLGLAADPLSPEHILLASILEHHWRQGLDITLEELIHAVQRPPFETLGVMALDTVYPAKERLKLAMAINALIAAPGFSVWTEGQPLDIQDLLYEESGKPRIAVIAINHLSDAERTFFLSLLLSEVVAWTRSQTGTGSLRALMYIDELFGFLPPVAEPPTKRPLLTLLKQARAFGVGLALSTQNPVDLDYKALSNAGTWFIGRLQTERDVARLIDGLRSARGDVDPSEISTLIGRLPKRTFLLHSVHQRAAVVFQTRWVMSYLAGPLSREQIRRLSRPVAPEAAELAGDAFSSGNGASGAHRPHAGTNGPPTGTVKRSSSHARPFLPPHVEQVFIGGDSGGESSRANATGARASREAVPTGRYFPYLLAVADVHYSSKTHGIDHSRRVARLVEPVEGTVPVDWALGESTVLDLGELRKEPLEGVGFGALPKLRWHESDLKGWFADFNRWLRTDGALQVMTARAYKLTSDPDESEREFRLRCAQAAREGRDDQKAKLLNRFGPKLDALHRRVLREEQSVDRERQQLQHRAVDTVGTLVGALFGSRRRSTAFSSTIRKASLGSKELGDVQRAQERLAQAERERLELESQLQSELAALEEISVHPEEIELERVAIRPVSRDVVLRFGGVAWVLHRQVNGRWVPDSTVPSAN